MVKNKAASTLVAFPCYIKEDRYIISRKYSVTVLFKILITFHLDSLT